MKEFFKRNNSTILTCLSVAGLVTTIITAIKATSKALEKIDEAERETDKKMTRVEKFKMVAPSYIPTLLIGAGTVACIFGANITNKRHHAALLSAYTLVDSSFKEYKDKLKDLYGTETHNKIINSIAVEKVDRDWITSGGYMGTYCTLSDEEACGDPVLFYEEFSNRYFESTIEQVISAEYHMNRNYALRGYSYLNELYEFLGIETTDYGSVMGWAPTDDGEYWIEFNHRKVVMDDGLECFILEMPFEPTYEPWDE